MNWAQLLALVEEACRREPPQEVLLVLRDSTFRVREVVGGASPTLLGFVASPHEAQVRSEETRLIFVPPERVERIEIHDGARHGRLGFER